ncbi:MAG: beta-propeller fold lactonase family protein, partial [Mucilaginibacter sp.]
AAAIHISPDGKFLYASNRHDASGLVIYAIDQVTGQLTLVGHQPTYGKDPRDFAIDPSGNYLLVANQGSNNILVFKIDKATGKLSLLRIKIDIGSPVCLKFTGAE